MKNINERMNKLREIYGDIDYKSVTTRAEALKRGWLIYNDKQRCKNDHYSDRRTCDGRCIACIRYVTRLKPKGYIPKNFVIHAPMFRNEEAELFLNTILEEINKDHPNVELEDILKKKIKISPNFYRYFIKAPDSFMEMIDEMSIKSIKGG